MRPVLTVSVIAAVFGLAGCGQAFAASPAPRAMARPAAQAKPMAQAKAAPKAAAIRQATPAEAAQYLTTTPDAQFVDVRTPEEFAEGRAKGAANRPLAELPRWAGSLAKDKPVVLICRSGSRSMKAATALQGQGFTNLVNVQGGTLGWEADGSLPMEFGPPKP